MWVFITPHFRGQNGPSPSIASEFTYYLVRATSLRSNYLGFENVYTEARKGSQESARDYCRKGEQSHHEFVLLGAQGPNFGKNADFYEFGSFGGKQGKRTDLQGFYQLVREGKSDLELAEVNFSAFSRTLKAIDRIRFSCRPSCNEGRKIILLVGKPGLGKTRYAYDTYPDLFELAIGSGIWFDGYIGQKVVLLDEFEGEMPLSSSLKVLDNYYVRMAPIKGSFTWWNPEVILLTSNNHPSLWYDYTKRQDKQNALRRRFTEIREYTNGSILVHDTPESIIEYWPIHGDQPVTYQNIDNNYLSNQFIK